MMATRAMESAWSSMEDLWLGSEKDALIFYSGCLRSVEGRGGQRGCNRGGDSYDLHENDWALKRSRHPKKVGCCQSLAEKRNKVFVLLLLWFLFSFFKSFFLLFLWIFSLFSLSFSFVLNFFSLHFLNPFFSSLSLN